MLPPISGPSEKGDPLWGAHQVRLAQGRGQPCSERLPLGHLCQADLRVQGWAGPGRGRERPAEPLHQPCLLGLVDVDVTSGRFLSFALCERHGSSKGFVDLLINEVSESLLSWRGTRLWARGDAGTALHSPQEVCRAAFRPQKAQLCYFFFKRALPLTAFYFTFCVTHASIRSFSLPWEEGLWLTERYVSNPSHQPCRRRVTAG